MQEFRIWKTAGTPPALLLNIIAYPMDFDHKSDIPALIGYLRIVIGYFSFSK